MPAPPKGRPRKPVPEAGAAAAAGQRTDPAVERAWLAELKDRFLDAAGALTARDFPWEALLQWEREHFKVNDPGEFIKVVHTIMDSYFKVVVPATGASVVLAKRSKKMAGMKGEKEVVTQEWVYRQLKTFAEENGNMVLWGVRLAGGWLSRLTAPKYSGADWHPPYSARALSSQWVDQWPGLAYDHDRVLREGDPDSVDATRFRTFVIYGLGHTENVKSPAWRELEGMAPAGFCRSEGEVADWHQRRKMLERELPGWHLWLCMALPYAYPGLLLKFVVVLYGIGGVGKSTMLKVYRRALGDDLWVVTTMPELTGTFNSGACRRLLVILEEATVDSRDQAESIKRLVDSEVVRIRAMRAEYVNSTWAANIWILNNSVDKPFHVSGGNRKVLPFLIDDGLLLRGPDGEYVYGGPEAGRWMDTEMNVADVAASMLRDARELGPEYDLAAHMPATIGRRDQAVRAVQMDPIGSFVRAIVCGDQVVPRLQWGTLFPSSKLWAAFNEHAPTEKAKRGLDTKELFGRAWARKFGGRSETVRRGRFERAGWSGLELAGLNDQFKAVELPGQEQARRVAGLDLEQDDQGQGSDSDQDEQGQGSGSDQEEA